MSVNSVYYSLLTLCVILSTNLVIAEESVPVFFWESAVPYSPLPALGRVNRETFKEIVEDRLASNPVFVVFVERSLSPEDFIESDNSGKETFPFLSSIKSFAHVTYYPFVNDPVGVVKHLPDVAQVKLKDFVKNPVLPESHVLIIDLSDAEDDENRIQMLRRHDSSMHQVYNILKKENKNILAAFTARHSSWIIPEKVENIRRTRDVLQVRAEGNGEERVFSTDNFLLFVNGSAVFSNVGTFNELNNGTIRSSITNNTLTVEIVASEVVIKFNFTLSLSRNWNLDAISGITSNGSEYSLVVRNIGAPQQFSYQCTNQIFFERNNPNRNLSLPGMQIQPFFTPAQNSTNITFGSAYFCVGFTTAPIWSGLFVTAILVIIMFIGLSMMMDIRTMDRFDDPKGKTIQINVAE